MRNDGIIGCEKDEQKDATPVFLLKEIEVETNGDWHRFAFEASTDRT